MKLFRILLITVIFSLGFAQSQAQEDVIAGVLKDGKTSEPLPYATIQIKGSRYGATTDEYGKYSFSVPNTKRINDSSIVHISFIGYKKREFTLAELKSNTKITLDQDLQQLRTFEVKGKISQEAEQVQSTQMSIVKLDMQEIKNLPAIGGEVDIIKAAQLLPGIAAGFEGSTGLYVRGGNADQNLVIYDEASLYEFGHLFGFFSIFNNDVVEDISILKGAFPANYGGRLSSVIDVKAKTGFADSLSGEGGIGLLSSRLTIRSPFAKKKGTLLISGRRTYIDQVAQLVDQNIPYYFYDLNGKIGYNINQNNTIWYSMYFGKDVLGFSDEDQPDGGRGFETNASYDKLNISQSLKWQHTYSPKFSHEISAVSTLFSYDILGKFEINEIKVQSKISDIGLKPKFTYQRNSNHAIEYGADVIYRKFEPNIINTAGEIEAFLESSRGPELGNFEYAGYGVSKHKLLNGLLAVDLGLRLSGSIVAGRNYIGLEPRLASRYTINENNAVKLSYTRMRQYVHRVSSSSVVLPTDLWYPVTAQIKPMTADQVAIGYDHLFTKIKTTATVEAYFKNMRNVIEYREGANLILNNDFENELVQGVGNAYGTEFLLKKRRGKVHGWIGYTLAWSTRQFDELNGGERFWAKYDRRNDFSSTASYDIIKRISISAIWVYSTGPRFTAQTGQYVIPDPTLSGVEIIPIYSKRNEISLSASHRLDINVVFKPKFKPNRKWYGELNVGAYNVYNQASPYQVQIEPQGNGYRYIQPGLFGVLPYFSYNFKF